MSKQERCDVCRFPKRCEYGYTFCSDYCATATAAEIAEWKAAKVGNFCVYPCLVCGMSIGDVLSRSRVCSSCYPKWSLKNLLRQCMKHVPEKLRKKIQEAVK
jgi:hypothetical protein